MKPQNKTTSSIPKVIYGDDNRLDLFNIVDRDWQLTASSTVALVDHRDLNWDDDLQIYRLKTKHFGNSFHLCIDEAFYDQPTASFCSGFLVGPEIVVTAGHCIRNEYNCQDVRLLFQYSLKSNGEVPDHFEEDDIYRCKQLIHTESNALTGVDFAILRLDRPVTNYSPLPIRTSGRIDSDGKLTVIGYPSGLPLKFAQGGVVRDNTQENFFVSNLDTFGGNSGSAVLNSESRNVEGILVRGANDYVYDQEAKCRRANRCPEDGCRGEDVVRIENILPYLTPNDLKP